MSFQKNPISFRKLQLTDLPLMHMWLNKPHVHEWYDKDKQNSLEEITRRYAPKIKGEKPTDCYFALYEGKPVGYIQTYRVNDWPELGDYIGYDDYTASVDLFIGDETFMGKGFGSQMLQRFLEEIVFSETNNIQTCVIGPEPNNEQAIRAYGKVGFRYAKLVHIPGEAEPSLFMEIKRNKLKDGW